MEDGDRDTPRYVSLAAKIVEVRSALGLTQATLAAVLGFRQQTISRWEAGTHRPTVSQVPALAALLKEDVATLMQLAAYGAPVSATLSTQFPVDALDPGTFEHFVGDLVTALYREAEVRVQGSRGHNQEGTDVVARFPDGRVWSFQCKRVERFGKADIEKAIAKHSFDADRVFLVLSKIASPGAIAAVQAYPGWTLWDKQDLTRQIRSLPVETQERLVDIYFRGQRMALLGRSEPGPWVTLDEYFAPFRGRGTVFSHDWSLVGREEEITALVGALDQGEMPVTVLVGPGGIGKTRVLKEAVSRFAAKDPGVAIRFLSASQEPNAASLEALGTGRKVLVVDDAHDREGLKLLIEHAVEPRRKTRLLIATRPYAEQRIRNELALYSVLNAPTVRLERLDKHGLRSLVVEVLMEFGGRPEWADAVLQVGADNPLVAAMAARVVAREGIIPEIARGHRELRQVILSRFTDVITGDLGAGADAAPLRAVLVVLAIIQPFHIDDRRIAELVKATRPGIAAGDVSRALRMLADGGVIYKRGQLHRLMPDLLGDFLIEQSCIGADGHLTPFALTVAAAVEGDRLTQVLVNLGRMDWRRHEGDPSSSALLEPIWRTLHAIEDRHDPRIQAVQAVAYYQPGQALGFIQALIERGSFLQEFSAILRRVAFSPEHRRDAIRLLWELGQNDERDLSPHPGHPIRVLAELVGYDQDKPLEFIEGIAEFAFALLKKPGAWDGCYTPLDVLKPILSGEGLKTTSTGRAFSMTPFLVNYQAVEPLRARLVGRMVDLLGNPDSRIAYRAALFLNDAVRVPLGAMGDTVPAETLEMYEAEFSQTVGRVGLLVAGGTLAPTTVVGIIKSLAWHAEYHDGALGDQVRAISAALPADLDSRFRAALAEGSDYSFTGQVRHAEWGEDREWLGGLAAELLAAYPDREKLCAALLAHRSAIEAAGMSPFPSRLLVDRLVAADPAFGRVIIDRSLASSDARLRDYLAIAVRAITDARPEEGRSLIACMLASPKPDIRSGGVRGLIDLRREPDRADRELLRELLGSTDPAIAAAAVAAFRTWRNVGEQETVALALNVDVGRMPELLDAICMLLCSRRPPLLDRLTEENVHLMLDRMVALPRLDGHWASELLTGLSKRHGILVARFLLARAELRLGDGVPEGFRVIGLAQRRGRLALHESPAVGEILECAWSWLRQHDDAGGWDRYWIGELFAAMFKLDSEQVVEFLDVMLDRATSGDLRWIADVLRNGHHRFAIWHRSFVERYLGRCRAVDSQLVKEAVAQLGAGAMSGSWSGAPGEPMPRDVRARDEATAVLASLSRLSPAYPLYSRILEHAKHNIARSIAEGEALDTED